MKDGYSTLQTLELLKSYTAYYIMKVRLLQQFIENIKRKRKKKDKMEKFLQSCVVFVKCKCGCKNDVIDLKWLLLEERIDSSTLKLVYNGINKENMNIKK